ncbi:MAG TPA: SDR family oxidoreductase [Jiangellaceae bacterium]|nr:SDR family oxidoreductase [Jiangellaceae bacterium]
MNERTVVVIGGTSGIGLEIARHVLKGGDSVVITGRDAARAADVAATLGEGASSVAVDLAEPETLAPALAGIERVDRLVLAAVERDSNTVKDYDIARARRLVTLKLVGYTEVVHTLLPRMSPDASIVIFGGRAKDRPYPGSTTVSTVNGGVDGLVRTMALELAPIRVNALHPGIIGDSPFWAGKPDAVLDAYRARTPGGQLATMADVVDAVDFLLRNRGVTGVSLYVDCGWEVT